jgi:hypothetical protein
MFEEGLSPAGTNRFAGLAPKDGFAGNMDGDGVPLLFYSGTKKRLSGRSSSPHADFSF